MSSNVLAVGDVVAYSTDWGPKDRNSEDIVTEINNGWVVVFGSKRDPYEPNVVPLESTTYVRTCGVEELLLHTDPRMRRLGRHLKRKVQHA